MTTARLSSSVPCPVLLNPTSAAGHSAYRGPPASPFRRRPSSFFRSLFHSKSDLPHSSTPRPGAQEDEISADRTSHRSNKLQRRQWLCLSTLTGRSRRHESRARRSDRFATVSSANRSLDTENTDRASPDETTVRQDSISVRRVEAEWRDESRGLREGFRECLIGAMCIAIIDPAADLTHDAVRSMETNDSVTNLRQGVSHDRVQSSRSIFDNIYTPLPDPMKSGDRPSLARNDSLQMQSRHGIAAESEHAHGQGHRYPDLVPSPRARHRNPRRRAAQAPDLEAIPSLPSNAGDARLFSQNLSEWFDSPRVSREMHDTRAAAVVEKAPTCSSVSVVYSEEDRQNRYQEARRSIRESARQLVDSLRDEERANPTPPASPANVTWFEPRLPRLSNEQVRQASALLASLPVSFTPTDDIPLYRRRRQYRPYPRAQPAARRDILNSQLYPHQQSRDIRPRRASRSASSLNSPPLHPAHKNERLRRAHVDAYGESPTPHTAWAMVPSPVTPPQIGPQASARPVSERGRERRRNRLERAMWAVRTM